MKGPIKKSPPPKASKTAARPAPAAYKLLLEYDGSRFHGWQKQSERQSAQGIRTVAGLIEKALREAGFPPLAFQGSGRTDAGVHALGQVAHLHLEPATAPRPHDLKRALEEGLPSDIVIRSLEACSPAFHARHDTQSRCYLYQLSLRRSAFGKPYLWWVKGRLNLQILEETWSLFQGNHDISAFADLVSGEDPMVQIGQCSTSRDGSLILLRVQAGFFLHRQVRRMVGAAVHCALGKESFERLQQDLKRPSPQANLFWSEKAAPAAGLFLESVSYGNGLEGPKRSVIWVP